MPEITEYTSKCEECGKEFKSKNKNTALKRAKECARTHEIVFIPLTRAQVQGVLAFFVSKDEQYLTPEIVKIFRSYRSLR